MNEEEFALQDETLRLAYETVAQSGCGAVVVDREEVITYVNRRFCEISGYSSAELVGQNPKILQSGNTPRETYLSLWNTVSSGRTWHGVLQNKKKNGEFYWEAITISPLKNAAGAITHFSAILEDVTEEKAAQASQAELDEEIFQEEKRESLAAMAIGMGHDLNNSLASMLAACNLARKAVDDRAKLLIMLDHIEAAAKASAGFVLQMSNLWRSSLPMPITMDLANVLGVHLSHYETITKRNLRWHHDGEPVPILGSPGLIHEAVLALLTNASEASEGAPIELRCGAIARLVPETEEHFYPCGLSTLSVAYIEVSDGGEGMDEYTIRRAFNPFFTTKAGHKGLGLATVYGIMASHKGAIGIISASGKGTRIRLYFRALTEKSALNGNKSGRIQAGS